MEKSLETFINNRLPEQDKTPTKVWARVGMTGYLTEAQLKKVCSGKVSRDEMLNWIKKGVFVLDGETYFPEPAEENQGNVPPDHEINF